MLKHRFSGFYAAILSGFADDGAFDEARQRALCAYVLRQDLDGLYVGGTTAEQTLMQISERITQLQVVAECAKPKQARLIAHVGTPSLRAAEILAKAASEASYDAISALPPDESHAARFDLVQDYYKAILQASGLPLFVYHYPSPARRAFSFEETSALLSMEGVAGIKFTSEDLYLFSRLRRAFPDRALLFGKDEIYAGGALFGADGGIGSTYNLVGGLYRAVHQCVEEANLDEAKRLQALSCELVVHLLGANLLPAIKRVLARRGVDCGPCRLPLGLGDPAAVKGLDDFIDSGVLDGFLN
ncbi:MAG: dihydrodipicolinate synthase family protein [Rhodospirillales bacterium]|nr:dihydrodipicolinate synthase family protein [Rhodospirillales bacterium]